MLVIMHYGNVQFLLQTAFDFETFGSLDVLQVDASEGGGDGLYGFDEFVGILLVHFDVEHVDATVYFEQQAFTLHYRFAGHSAYVTQS